MGNETRAPEPPFLLDTGAILQGLNLPPAQCVTTPSVLAEIQAGGATGRRAAYLRDAGLIVTEPSEADRQKVRRKANDSGALGRLSAVDVDILALALGHQGTLVSDDYTVLDVARRLGVTAVPATTRGITEGRSWAARCTGCRRSYAQAPEDGTCRVCGSPVRLRAQRTP